MTNLSWNCHVSGTPWAFQFLKEIILQKHPDFVFLSEILCRRDTVERLQTTIGFEGMVVVETQGHSGGIVFLWRHKEEATLKSYNKNHIDLQIVNKNGEEYRMIGVYGEPDRRKRCDIWNLLRTLAMDNSLPWCLIGDLNNVVSQNDKRGGRPYLESLIQGFREVLDDCNLIDIDLHDHQYTWEMALEVQN
ncbi:uncharacterized protein LOC141674825 [Apium graveolens]|uniref:uncharacterized protein LOC141674825 n=1 Tax=Apium graveolens TaxID=4045 RepID=UPI003D7BA02A